MSHFFSGFQRPDRRGWLGFHEGVSNIQPEERLGAIVINNTNISKPSDVWTVGGTYLAFLRIAINLETWLKTSVRDQELIVGRHKLTGCPLIGTDLKGNPVTLLGVYCRYRGQGFTPPQTYC